MLIDGVHIRPLKRLLLNYFSRFLRKPLFLKIAKVLAHNTVSNLNYLKHFLLWGERCRYGPSVYSTVTLNLEEGKIFVSTDCRKQSILTLWEMWCRISNSSSWLSQLRQCETCQKKGTVCLIMYRQLKTVVCGCFTRCTCSFYLAVRRWVGIS